MVTNQYTDNQDSISSTQIFEKNLHLYVNMLAK